MDMTKEEIMTLLIDPTPEQAKAQAAEIRATQSERMQADESDLPITAELHDWWKQAVGSGDDFIIWGHAYNDTRMRFCDGTPVRTSLIAKIVGDIAVTLNSNYRLIGEEKGGF